MKIIDLLKPNSIALNYAPESKEQLYDKLISLHDGAGTISDKKQFKADILKREEEGPTAIGDGVAIPHAKSEAVRRPGLAAVTVPGGIPGLLTRWTAKSRT